MENPIKMDDLGGTTIFGTIHMYHAWPTVPGGHSTACLVFIRLSVQMLPPLPRLLICQKRVDRINPSRVFLHQGMSPPQRSQINKWGNKQTSLFRPFKKMMWNKKNTKMGHPLDIQTPPEIVHGHQNPPKTPSEVVFGCLGTMIANPGDGSNLHLQNLHSAWHSPWALVYVDPLLKWVFVHVPSFVSLR